MCRKNSPRWKGEYKQQLPGKLARDRCETVLQIAPSFSEQHREGPGSFGANFGRPDPDRRYRRFETPVSENGAAKSESPPSWFRRPCFVPGGPHKALCLCAPMSKVESKTGQWDYAQPESSSRL